MIAEFLTTLRHAPCARDTSFSEFYERFVEWLPKGCPRWSRTKTARELRRHRELFRGYSGGNSNVLMLVDGSFRFSYDQSADEERMAKFRGLARWVDDGAEGYWEFKGRRVTVQELIQSLGGLTGEEIYRLRMEWRANPVCLFTNAS